MRILKNHPYILSILALLFVVNVGLANTTDKDNKNGAQEQEQEQEGRRKSDQTMIQPDGAATQLIDQDLQEEDAEEEPSETKKAVYRPINEIDSTKDESVSKYNFIFYFLYKFKYDGEESP